MQEDQDAMEVDLDKDEVVRAEGDEQSGEKLLADYMTESNKLKRRVGSFVIHFCLYNPAKLMFLGVYWN